MFFVADGAFEVSPQGRKRPVSPDRVQGSQATKVETGEPENQREKKEISAVWRSAVQRTNATWKVALVQ